MKKILITSNLYLPNIGGIENSLYYLADAGIENNDDVTIIASDIIDEHNISSQNRKKINCTLLKYNVPSKKCKVYNILRHYYNAYKLYKKINKNGCDLVIARFHFNVLLAYFAGLKNILYVVPGVIKYQNSPADMNDNKNLFFSNIKFNLHSLVQYHAFKRSRKIYVFSNNMEEQIKSIIPNIDIYRTLPGIDYIKFSLSKIIIDKKVNLLIISRLVSVKNIGMAIKSLQYLNSKYTLTIVGDGADKNMLETLAKTLNLAGRIIFEGLQSEVVQYYHNAHIFLLPSTYEPFGQTILEASSCGVPTVSFNSNIVNTDTTNILGDLGVFSNQLNALDYSKAIEVAFNRFYIEKSTRREDLRESIIEKYSWSNLYKDLLKDVNE